MTPELHLDGLLSHLPAVGRSIETHYLQLSTWLEAHLPQIGTVIAASILSLYARLVTDKTRRLAQEWPFLLRVGLFVGIAGFGFGLIIASTSPLVSAGLQLAGTPYLVPVTFACFLVVGILAERSGRI